MFLNLSGICRLCLLHDGTLSIFHEDLSVKQNRVPILQKIMNCVSIEVFEGDGLPALICQQCCTQLDKFYEFKELCESSDSTLHQYLTKLQPDATDSQALPIKQERAMGTIIHNNGFSSDPMQNCEKGIENGVTFEEPDNEFCDNLVKSLEYNSKVSDTDDERTSKENSLAEKEVESSDTFLARSLCSKPFAKKLSFRKHEVTYDGEKSLTCQKCDSTEVVQHVTDRSKDKNCAQENSELFNTVNHKSDVVELFSCKICSKSFNKRVYLKRHEVIHSGKRPFACKECGSTFSRTGDLAKHLRIHERGKFLSRNCLDPPVPTDVDINKNAELMCKVCSRSFTKEYYLKQHLVVHSEANIFLCEECGKSFYRRGALTQHKVTHSGVKSHSCNVCNKSFTFLGRLKEHERLHTGIKAFLCNVCGKVFATKEGLLSHERTHSGEKPFACSLCDKHFATSSNLRTHTRHHTEGKRFACAICGMAFFTKSGLERHARLHTGLKPFSCEVCHMSFYTKREMIRHNAYHLGNKRFSCDKCSKSYFERQHLVIHERTHSGERPYACNWCKKSFFERSKLKRHMQTHVRNKL